MGMLKVAASASFALVLSSLQAESAKPVGFEGDVPERTFVNMGLSVQSYDFAAVTDQSPSVMKQAMYDRKLGIACSWTLTRVESDFRMAVSGHVCSRREEPDRWKEAAPDDNAAIRGTAGISLEFDAYGDKSRVGQFSVTASFDSPYIRHYARIWKAETHEACLVSGLSVGPAHIAEINHGCFKMTPSDFVIKRAISSPGPFTSV